MNNITINEDGLKIPYNCIIPANVERKDWLGSGKIGTVLVPDYIWGVSVKKAGFIHDWCYDNQIGKKLADEIFLFNLIKLIENANLSYIIKTNAKIIANYYYNAVRLFGQSAYDKCKK